MTACGVGPEISCEALGYLVVTFLGAIGDEGAGTGHSAHGLPEVCQLHRLPADHPGAVTKMTQGAGWKC